jgi:hypothetical protein
MFLLILLMFLNAQAEVLEKVGAQLKKIRL